ncbi:MAG: SDR family NAD(P)-dependent oxidoreductase [Geminicoccaceae bacterium]|nr:SDR family NAD(P)-dependent oxidoreductase [Geminicoccaceae bacterium]
MIEDLDGKAVLVTGASSGIGAATARAFGRNGARVAVHYHRNEGAEQVATDIRAEGRKALVLQADVRDSAAAEDLVRATIDAFGRIDVLINNAGDVVAKHPVDALPDDFVLDLFKLNVLSVIATSRVAIPAMREAGGGAIVNTSSVGARHGGSAGTAAYAGTKAYINSLTRHMAREHAPDRIRVNAVSPGVILTPIHERHSSRELMETYKTLVPMGRYGTPEETAGAYLYFASDQLSGYVTGQILEVNGGQLSP